MFDYNFYFLLLVFIFEKLNLNHGNILAHFFPLYSLNLKIPRYMRFEVRNSGWFLYLVITIYLITAYYSVGFHHYDEHYQILEFASYKLGIGHVDGLAWEFKARIRSSIQPAMALGIFKMLIWLGIRDRFIWAFSLRLITSLFALLIVNRFIKSSLPEIDKEVAPFYVFASYLLWFLPYINVRYSSESWAGLMFMAGITIIFSKSAKRSFLRYLCLGTLMGLSVLFRYQSAILVISMLSWLYFVRHLSIKDIGIITLVVIIILIAGVVLDTWFYGERVVTIFNYFDTNIVQGRASYYGVLPWYQYLLYIVEAPLAIVGIPILLALLALIYYDKKNVIIWTVVPFVVIHSLIPHKELRFLFQVANLTPAVLAFGLSKANIADIFHDKFRPVIVVGSVAINLIALVCLSTKGAGDGRLVIAKYIHDNYAGNTVNLILDPNANPYDEIPPTDYFYKNYSVAIFPITLEGSKNLLMYKLDGFTNLLAVYDNSSNNPAIKTLIDSGKLKKLKTSVPWVCVPMIKLYDKTLASKIITLYEFK